MAIAIGHVDNIPTMQFLTTIPRNTRKVFVMLSLTEFAQKFQKVHSGILFNTPCYR